MSMMLRLGMPLGDVIDRVTAAPAKAISLDDRSGALGVGMPADITVFRIEDGEFELVDCFKQVRKVDRQIVPVMTFKKASASTVRSSRACGKATGSCRSPKTTCRPRRRPSR